MNNNMLVDVLLVSPKLALQIGLNEAIVLQQLYFWLNNPQTGKVVDGQRWMYNSAKEWRESNFPFWSEKTIRRTLQSLEEQGIVLSRDDLNDAPYDRTKWYSIDSNWQVRDGQIVQVMADKKSTPIPENTREEEKSGGVGQDELVSTLPSADTPNQPEAVRVAAPETWISHPFTAETPEIESVTSTNAAEGWVAASTMKATDASSYPTSLDTPEFRAKWQEWIQFRRETKHPLKPTTTKKQWAMLSKYPVAYAIAMLEQSMLNGWQGIFELKTPLPTAPPDPSKPVYKLELVDGEVKQVLVDPSTIVTKRTWTPLGSSDKEARPNGSSRAWTPLGSG